MSAKEENVVKVYYATDEKGTDPENPDTGDKVPDKYQVEVNFNAVNGTVTPEKVYVTLFDSEGQWSETGTGHLTDEQVAAIKAVANPGYDQETLVWAPKVPTVTLFDSEGQWSETGTGHLTDEQVAAIKAVANPGYDQETLVWAPKVPTKDFTITKDGAEFTATFTEASLPLVINYVDEAGNVVAPKYESTVKFNSGFEVKSPVVEGYALLNPEQSVIKGTMDVDGLEFTVVYATDEKGTDPENPDTGDKVPDKYQTTVTFTAVNGTVDVEEVYVTLFDYATDEKGTDPENPDTGDKVPDKYQTTVTFTAVNGTVDVEEVYVTLFDSEGQWSENGIGHLTDEQIQAINPTANEGFSQDTLVWAPKVPTKDIEMNKDGMAFVAVFDEVEVPVVPVDPTDPTDPTTPTLVWAPKVPTKDIEMNKDGMAFVAVFDEVEVPVVPVDPTDPTDPTTPVDPVVPTNPTTPPTTPVGPTTPVAPTVPAGDAGVVDVEEVEDNETPLADLPEEEINDNETPLAKTEGTWALVNLISTIITVALGLILLISRKKKEEDQDSEEVDANEDPLVKKRGTFTRVVSVIIAILSVIAFLVTEDMTLKMAMVDKWTIMMVVMAVVQVIVFVFGRKWKDQDNENKNEQVAM